MEGGSGGNVADQHDPYRELANPRNKSNIKIEKYTVRKVLADLTVCD